VSPCADPAMNDQDAHRITLLLEEIRDNQKLHLAQQAEIFAHQKKQSDRTDRIQDRAEQIQAKSAQLVSGSRRTMLVLLPIILGLIAYVSWLMFSRLAR